MGTERCQQNKRNNSFRHSCLAIAGAMSVSVLLLNPGHVQASPPITPSGLNTEVNLSATPPPGHVQYDITGGTRPGGGMNLFHSFGDFGVPANNIANFLNETGLPTSTILGRVTGGNISNIFGTIQTTGFGNANLFLMNPAGFLFGQNATVNVGGMVTFTTADYLRLTGDVRFNAVPNAAADALLSAAPVAAFGFLTSSPAPIQIQDTQLFLDGQTISLVGGDIEIDGGGVGGGIAAPNGRIEIASVASPGEVVRTTQGLNVDAFAQLGTVSLTNNAVLTVSDFNGTGAGAIHIRGGRFLMDQSMIAADTFGNADGSPVGIDIGVRNDVVLQNSSVISSTTQGGLGRASDIAITTSSVLVDNLSAISSSSIDVPGRAGNITLTVDQLTVTGGGGIQAGAFGPGQAGSITINGAESVIVSGNFGGDPTLPSLITSQSQSPTQDAGSISITTPSLAIMDGARVEANSFAAGRGGDVVLNVHNLTMSGGAQIKTSSQPFFVSPEIPAGAGDIHVNATATISLSGAGTGLFSETSGPGNAGNITLNAGAVTFESGGHVTSRSVPRAPLFDGDEPPLPTGNAGLVTIQGLTSPAQSVLIEGTGSGIFTDTQGAGAGGNITLNANMVTLQNGGALSTKTSSSGDAGDIGITSTTVLLDSGAKVTAETGADTTGHAGDIAIHAGQFSAQGGSFVTSSTSGSGNGGAVSVIADDSIHLSNSFITSSVVTRLTTLTTPLATGNGGVVQLRAPTIELQNSRISTSTNGLGNAGSIDIGTGQLSLSANSFLSARTVSSGEAGNISIHGLASPDSHAQSVTLTGSTITSETQGIGDYKEGSAGNISIKTGRLSLLEGGSLRTAALGSSGSAGNIMINATQEVRVSQSEVNSSSQDISLGHAGNVTILSPSVVVENEGSISTATDFTGRAGDIDISTGFLQLQTGGHVTSSNLNVSPESPPTSDAGNVTVHGQAGPGSHATSVLIDGGAISTETQGTGAGGSISLNANSVTLQNGAHVSSSSIGTGIAGHITITASNQVSLTNSSVTTEADQASGGTIKITTNPSGTVQLTNSLISASVLDGAGGGGSVEIDPLYVILLNSHILANAVEGPGGNITINISNGGLFLPDANSTIRASSQFGVDGTVTIQSPNAPISGQIQPIGATPLHATSLLNQHCAALADGQFSSFTVGARDSLPTEPGSWLASPLATLSAGTGRVGKAEGVKAEGGRSVARGEGQESMAMRASLASERTVLSLRQIAPAGFLTQAFAVNGSTGCTS